jgi:uncharacterized protein DUF6682
MTYTVQQVVTEARGFLQDTVPTYRYSDTDLAQYASDCLDVLADHLPQLFTAFRSHTCAAGARQAFSSVGSKGLIDVIEVVGGGSISFTDREMLDRYAPKWRTAVKPGAAVEWMSYPGDRYTFDLYPPAPAGQIVNVQHVATPPELSIGGTLDERLTPVANLIVDYVVGMAEAREAEEVGPQREQLFVSSFVTKIKGMGK